MERVLESESVEKYLEEVQKLKVLSTNDPEKLEKLLDFVLDKQKSFLNSPEADFLFAGEHAFHNGNYEQALINYMQARSIPNFEFFCYRATAYVSFLRADKEKALSFILKTLDFKPFDYDSLKLYREILLQNKEEEKAKEIGKKIEAIEKAENLTKNSKTIKKDSSVEETAKETEGQEDFNPRFSEADLLTKKGNSKMNKEKRGVLSEEFKEDFSSEKSPLKETPKAETTSHFIATKLGVDLDTEQALEMKIQEFQKAQSIRIETYLEESKKNRRIKEDALYILNSWKAAESSEKRLYSTSEETLEILKMEQVRKTSGGFFIRWNGKGIAINPGPNFLENFHQQGLYIGDINFVIVTQNSKDSHADIKRIYDLNYQLNKISPELHVITYYLNHKAYQELSHTLKPNFKQERNTIHCLELFLDSPDVEKEELFQGICLNYFSTSSRGGYVPHAEAQDFSNSTQASCMGIRLDLDKGPSSNASDLAIKIGYISETAWSPLLAHHLGKCNILISGFGTTCPNDYGKLNYNENSLGYYGTYTLLEEVKPQILLLTEFDGRDGDIRLEITKKLRKEYEKANPQSLQIPSIIPADKDLFIDLKSQKIECSISKALLEPKDVIVVKSAETFGKLRYLSPGCIL